MQWSVACLHLLHLKINEVSAYIKKTSQYRLVPLFFSKWVNDRLNLIYSSCNRQLFSFTNLCLLTCVERIYVVNPKSLVTGCNWMWRFYSWSFIICTTYSAWKKCNRTPISLSLCYQLWLVSGAHMISVKEG